MIDQLRFAGRQPGKKRHLGIGRAALHQQAPGYYTDTAIDRRADARRQSPSAVHGWRFKRFFQRI